MHFFLWLTFLIAIVVAIFAIQNSTAPEITLKFLIWQFKTSLTYTVGGSFIAGMAMIILLWIPASIRKSLRPKNVKK